MHGARRSAKPAGSNKEYSTSSSSTATAGRRRNADGEEDDDDDDHRDPLDVDVDSMDEDDDDADETCAADERYAPHPRLMSRPHSENYYAVAGICSPSCYPKARAIYFDPLTFVKKKILLKQNIKKSRRLSYCDTVLVIDT